VRKRDGVTIEAASLAVAFYATVISVLFALAVDIQNDERWSKIEPLISFENATCVEHELYLKTFDKIRIDDEWVKMARLYVENMTLEEVREHFGDHLIEECVKVENPHGLTADPELVLRLGWKR
jgi:hypothetical protein